MQHEPREEDRSETDPARVDYHIVVVYIYHRRPNETNDFLTVRGFFRRSNRERKLMLDDICDAETNATLDEQHQSIDWDTMLQFMINVC